MVFLFLQSYLEDDLTWKNEYLNDMMQLFYRKI